MPPFPPFPFALWMDTVNKCVVAATGLDTNDLPDVAYRDWYDAGVPAGQAAKRAVRNAMAG